MVYGTALSSKEPNKPSKICNVSYIVFTLNLINAKRVFFLIAMLEFVNLQYNSTCIFFFTFYLHPVQTITIFMFRYNAQIYILFFSLSLTQILDK